jgi:hypothetical protein
MLTYMATLEQLEKDGVLSRAFPKLVPQVRQIWVTAKVSAWIKNELAAQTAIPRPGEGDPVRPLVQAKVLFERFITGKEMFHTEDFWLMRPEEDDVFELKSDDVRFFGWFPERKKFLIAAANSMENCHTYKLHDGYRNEVKHIRNGMDLSPKLVVGAEPKDVL